MSELESTPGRISTGLRRNLGMGPVIDRFSRERFVELSFKDVHSIELVEIYFES